MAVITPIQTNPIDGNSEFMLVSWPNMANGDTGAPFILAQYADRSVQVEGTFGAGGLVNIEGTNDTVNWAVLNDPFSNAIAISTSQIEAVTELVVQIRPNVAGGDGTTNLTVSMLVRKNK